MIKRVLFHSGTRLNNEVNELLLSFHVHFKASQYDCHLFCFVKRRIERQIAVAEERLLVFNLTYHSVFAIGSLKLFPEREIDRQRSVCRPLIS